MRPPLRSALAFVPDELAHLGGEAIYFLIECGVWLFGKSKSRHETRIARRAAHGYWEAKALRRRGKPDEALKIAKAAYGLLRNADREATFSEMLMLVMLVDKLASEADVADGARDEMTDALEVCRAIHADSSRRSQGLDQTVKWLQYRLGTEGK